jgi:DNA-binding LacI/PurR family transcriptional regulator
MNWELYEVWARHNDAYEELIITTKDLNEAKAEAKEALKEESVDECIIYREDEDGESEEISRMYRSGP